MKKIVLVLMFCFGFLSVVERSESASYDIRGRDYAIQFWAKGLPAFDAIYREPVHNPYTGRYVGENVYSNQLVIVLGTNNQGEIIEQLVYGTGMSSPYGPSGCCGY